MTLVREAGSMRSSIFWAAITWPLFMSRLIQARAPSTGAGTLPSSPTMVTAGAPAATGATGADAASCACDRKEAEVSASAAPKAEREEMSFRLREVIGIDKFGLVVGKTNEEAAHYDRRGRC